MGFEDLTSGTVIHYPFLWSHEAERGELAGRKMRPTAVGLRLPRPSGDVLLLFPLTSKPPLKTTLAAEIPEIEKRRAGLAADMQIWIILDEFNEDVIGKSFYLEPQPALGKFSKAYFLSLMKLFIANRAKARHVGRSDKL